MIDEPDAEAVPRPLWMPPPPEPVRDAPDGQTVQVLGRLTYVVPRTNRQGGAFLTGVVRDAAGDAQFWVPPTSMHLVSDGPEDGDEALLMARVDRRPGTPPMLTMSQLTITERRPEVGPRRGDAVAEWIKRARDECDRTRYAWGTLDDLLNDYQDHADTRTPLDREVQGPNGDGS